MNNRVKQEYLLHRMEIGSRKMIIHMSSSVLIISLLFLVAASVGVYETGKVIHTFSSVSLTVRLQPPPHPPPRLVSWFVTMGYQSKK